MSGLDALATKNKQLCNALHVLERFGEAFTCYGHTHHVYGNQTDMMRLPPAITSLDTSWLLRSMRGFRRYLNRARFTKMRRNLAPEPPQLVLIVGMMRSGSSLVEQVLQLHPDVVPAGENTLLDDFLRLVQEKVAGVEHLFQDQLLDLFNDKDAVQEMARQLTFQIQKLRGNSTARFLTVKSNHNFLHLWAVRKLYPNSIVIHTQRDVRDNGLSIYATGSIAEFSRDIQSIASVINEQLELWSHWRNIGLQFYRVHYENLVLDTEAEVRRLLNYIGLPFDLRCLLKHHTEAPEHHDTEIPSTQQVAKPIYNSSVGKWKHYEDWIQPLTQIAKRCEKIVCGKHICSTLC